MLTLAMNARARASAAPPRTEPKAQTKAQHTTRAKPRAATPERAQPKATAARARPSKASSAKSTRAQAAQRALSASPSQSATVRHRKPSVDRALDPRLRAIAAALRDEPRVTIGKVFSSVGLRVNGKIFVMVVRGNVVMKLPRARVAQLVADNAGQPFEPAPGRSMKEWITLTAGDSSLRKLGREAFNFVAAGK